MECSENSWQKALKGNNKSMPPMQRRKYSLKKALMVNVLVKAFLLIEIARSLKRLIKLMIIIKKTIFVFKMSEKIILQIPEVLIISTMKQYKFIFNKNRKKWQ